MEIAAYRNFLFDARCGAKNFFDKINAAMRHFLLQGTWTEMRNDRHESTHSARFARVGDIDGAVRGQIGQGFLVLLGITDGDTADDAVYLADKTVKLRVFTDENDKMNRSLADVGGGILIVSQFTLYGDCKKGNRPSFTAAARPETAIPLYERFIARCRESGLPVETGEFGADMKVDLLNDGPVTLWMDTAQMR